MLLERNVVRHVQGEGTLGVDVLSFKWGQSPQVSGVKLALPVGFPTLAICESHSSLNLFRTMTVLRIPC